MKTITITTRFYGSAFYARGGGKTCSSTSDECWAVAGLVKKLGGGDAIPTSERKCQLTTEGWQQGRWTLEIPLNDQALPPGDSK